MEVLKTLVVVVIVLAVAINAEEETNRKGKCGGNKNSFGSHQKHKVQFRKPYPLSHQDGSKFTGKKQFYPKAYADATPFQLPAKDQIRQPSQSFVPARPISSQDTEDAIAFSDSLVADPIEIPSSFGISPRISISADGEVTVARSIKFNHENNFHDDGSLENGREHEHMDEDSDHFHKIRTARSATNKDSKPQQLAASLEELKGTSTMQGVDVNNGAHSGEYFQMQASGDNISAGNSGSSSASGSGTIYATGTTSVTTSGNSGW